MKARKTFCVAVQKHFCVRESVIRNEEKLEREIVSSLECGLGKVH